MIATGRFSQGLKMIKAMLEVLMDHGRLFTRYLLEVSSAEIYFQTATSTRRFEFWATVKNLGFILKEVPFAKRKAQACLTQVLQVGKEGEPRDLCKAMPGSIWNSCTTKTAGRSWLRNAWVKLTGSWPSATQKGFPDRFSRPCQPCVKGSCHLHVLLTLPQQLFDKTEIFYKI
jgi:hypothetical protein